MRLFGKSKIEGPDLQKCLTYYEAQSRLTALQSQAANAYNEAMAACDESTADQAVAAQEASKAAKRHSQVSTEVLQRHNAIESVPEAASSFHSAWSSAFSAYSAWAAATALRWWRSSASTSSPTEGPSQFARKSPGRPSG